MHHRLSPKEHRFQYSIFMFYLNLNELETLDRRLRLFSVNRFNWFNFRFRDHLRTNGEESPGLKQRVLSYLGERGIELQGGKIMLLTNVTTLGYTFNPISFYLCFDERGQPICSVAEVCNTYGEMKL